MVKAVDHGSDRRQAVDRRVCRADRGRDPALFLRRARIFTHGNWEKLLGSSRLINGS
jgi:hypothetical protein